jgi:hypothetical protein
MLGRLVAQGARRGRERGEGARAAAGASEQTMERVSHEAAPPRIAVA